MQKAKLRLDEMLDKSGECWLFTGHTNNKGYGIIWYKGRPRGAHRVALELANGRPPKLHVLHSCNTPACCNPTHLREGTNKENMQDRTAAGTGYRVLGDKHPMSKLTWEHVVEIRAQPTLKLRELAVKYNVSVSTISGIRNNRTWKEEHYGNPK